MSPADLQTSYDLAYIYWDSDVERFRDQSTGQIVPNIIGIQTLTAGRPFGKPGFYDQFGNIAPSPANLNYPGYSLDFQNVSRDFSVVAQDPYEHAAGQDQYYASIFTYQDEEGNLHLGQVNARIGEAINSEDEFRRIVGVIADQQDIPIGQRGSEDIFNDIVSVFHFLAS